MKQLKIFTDGGARGNPGPAGIGVYVVGDQNQVLFQQSAFIGRATNNEAEYKALLASLEWLREYLKANEVECVKWILDSKLVVEQVKRQWKIKEPRLQLLANEVWEYLDKLPCKYELLHVRREKNRQADGLVNQALNKLA